MHANCVLFALRFHFEIIVFVLYSIIYCTLLPPTMCLLFVYLFFCFVASSRFVLCFSSSKIYRVQCRILDSIVVLFAIKFYSISLSTFTSIQTVVGKRLYFCIFSNADGDAVDRCRAHSNQQKSKQETMKRNSMNAQANRVLEPRDEHDIRWYRVPFVCTEIHRAQNTNKYLTIFLPR